MTTIYIESLYIDANIFMKFMWYTFMAQGAQRVMYGTITVVSADNLGGCSLGGFKEGSTAYRGYRHCLATPGKNAPRMSVTVMRVYSNSRSSFRNHLWNFGHLHSMLNNVLRQKLQQPQHLGLNFQRSTELTIILYLMNFSTSRWL